MIPDFITFYIRYDGKGDGGYGDGFPGSLVVPGRRNACAHVHDEQLLHGHKIHFCNCENMRMFKSITTMRCL